MNKLGKVAVALAMVFSVGAAFGYSSASYVQDGLIAQWDGIDNALSGAGRVHKGDATTWADLSGGGHDMNGFSASFGFTDDALVKTAAGAITQGFGLNPQTFEIVIDFSDCALNQWLVPLSATDKYYPTFLLQSKTTYEVFYGYKMYGFKGAALPENGKVALSCSTDGALYANGEKMAQNFTEFWSAHGDNVLGGSSVGHGNNGNKGFKIHSIRLYDRVLTDEERAKNVAVDNVRFLGKVDGSCLIVEGNPGDFGTAGPTYGVNTGYVAGQTVPCSVTKTWTNGENTLVATCTGYEVRADGAVVASGTFAADEPSEFAYEHPDSSIGANLIWKFDVKSLVTATADTDGVTMTVEPEWAKPGETVTVTAEYDADALAIRGWDGVRGTMDGDTFTFVMPAKPVVCTAKMTRLYAVAVTGDDDADGTRAAPFATLGKALAAAAASGAPSVVSVGSGEYELTTGLSYAGAEPVRVYSEEGAEKTILVRTAKFENMLTLNNTDSTFDGFTFTQRDSSKSGNVLVITAGTVSHCIVSNTWFTKGISLPTNGRMTDSLICGNHQSGRDAVVSMVGGTIERSQIVRNMTSNGTYGEGLEFWNGGTARNCLVADNTNEANHASGVFVNNGTILVENCTIANNVTLGATAVAGVVGTVGTFRNCIVYGNRNAGGVSETADRTYVNCASSAELSGSGNVKVAAMDFADAAAGDYRVLSGPTIDTALPQSRMLTETDLAGNPRLIGEGPDMGCYEYKPGALRVSVVASGTDFLGSGNVTLTASPSGSDLTGVTYDWRVLCDGETVATGDEATLTLTGLGWGVYDVVLTVANAAGDSFTWEDGASLVTVHPKTVYVAKDSTPTPPYGSWETAARELADALEGAVGGMDVQVGPGVYTNTRCAIITADIRVKGVAGRDRTFFERTQSGFQLLQLANAAARFEGITFRQPQRNSASGGRVFTLSAGTIADCRVENCYAYADELSYVTGGLVTNTIWRGNYNWGRTSNCTINGASSSAAPSRASRRTVTPTAARSRRPTTS